jgi:hypothetical protein
VLEQPRVLPERRERKVCDGKPFASSTTHHHPHELAYSNTIVARSQFSTNDLSCCPAANVRSQNGLPAQVGGVYKNYDVSWETWRRVISVSFSCVLLLGRVLTRRFPSARSR